jgi:hypothetical protein
VNPQSSVPEANKTTVALKKCLSSTWSSALIIPYLNKGTNFFRDLRIRLISHNFDSSENFGNTLLSQILPWSVSFNRLWIKNTRNWHFRSIDGSRLIELCQLKFDQMQNPTSFSFFVFYLTLTSVSYLSSLPRSYDLRADKHSCQMQYPASRCLVFFPLQSNVTPWK